jgi:hypothetical protein
MANSLRKRRSLSGFPRLSPGDTELDKGCASPPLLRASREPAKPNAEAKGTKGSFRAGGSPVFSLLVGKASRQTRLGQRRTTILVEPVGPQSRRNLPAYLKTENGRGSDAKLRCSSWSPMKTPVHGKVASQDGSRSHVLRRRKLRRRAAPFFEKWS